jgi:GTPase
MKKARKLNKENYYGYIEYKINLIDVHNLKCQKYASQMKFRLKEGDGKCIYNIGYNDEGYPIGLNDNDANISLINLNKIIELIGAEIKSKKIFMGIRGIIINLMIVIPIDKLGYDSDIIDFIR